MQVYAAQFEDRASATPKTIVVGRAADLTSAIKLLESTPLEADVAYNSANLQRRVFKGRIVWLDAHGKEVASPPHCAISPRSS